MVPGRKGNDDTGACPTAYQAARSPRPEPQGDITKARRIAHDRGQVRQTMGIIHPDRRTAPARADRWSTTGTRPSWTDGRPPTRACRSSNAIPRPACTSGSWRNAGSRARTRRCSAGSSVGGRSIERGRTASTNRSGRREARRSISARPGPWSRAWNGSCVSRRCRSRTRTCAGWRHCRARPRNACARDCRRCSRGRA